jgi:peptidoglycan LD-endopeptidase CwlK
MADSLTKYRFSASSKRKLDTVHPKLRLLIQAVMDEQVEDFMVIEGVRTLERQKELLAKGVTRTLASKHLPDNMGYSRAIDIAPIPLDFSDKQAFKRLIKRVKAKAKELNIRIRSGSDWDMNDVVDEEELKNYIAKFKRRPLVDYPHLELVG